jgi:hypothetical protein
MNCRFRQRKSHRSMRPTLLGVRSPRRRPASLRPVRVVSRILAVLLLWTNRWLCFLESLCKLSGLFGCLLFLLRLCLCDGIIHNLLRVFLLELDADGFTAIFFFQGDFLAMLGVSLLADDLPCTELFVRTLRRCFLLDPQRAITIPGVNGLGGITLERVALLVSDCLVYSDSAVCLSV